MPTSPIQTYLNNIMTAIYGEEVRGSIHDAIKLCYDEHVTDETAIGMKGLLANGTDLDTKKENGTWILRSSYTYDNAPFDNKPGLLLIFDDEGTGSKFQIAFESAINPTPATGKIVSIYIRQWSTSGEGSWADWKSAGYDVSGVLPTGADMDDYKETSAWIIRARSNTYDPQYVNCPVYPLPGVLLTYSWGDPANPTYVIQIAFQTYVNTSDQGALAKTYIRRRSSREWQSWHILGYETSGPLANGTDVNDIKTTSIWTVPSGWSDSSHNITNLPSGFGFGILQVFSAESSSTVYQLAIQAKSAGGKTVAYFRYFAGSAWHDWAKIGNDDPVRGPLYGKNVVCIGDGLTYNDPDHPEYRYFDVFEEAGAIVKDHGYASINSNGALFTANTSSSGTVISEHESEWDTDLSGADVVIIFGGMNDLQSNTSPIGNLPTDWTSQLIIDNTKFVGAIGHILNHCKVRAKTADIFLATPIPSGTAGRVYSIAKPYVDAMKEVARFWGVPVIDLFNEFDVTPYHLSSASSDVTFNRQWDYYFDQGGGTISATKPNALGMKRIGEIMLKHIINYR